MRARRIVSFLPAATEMACALGLEDQLAGVSHECDYPASVRGKPVVVRAALDFASLAPRDIDGAVAARMRAGDSLYAVDETLLRTLDADVILTQDLCQVCAPSGNDVTRLIASLERRPEVLYFTPRTLDDVWKDLVALAAASETTEIADAIIDDARARLDAVTAAVRVLRRVGRSPVLRWALGTRDDRDRGRQRSAHPRRRRLGARAMGRRGRRGAGGDRRRAVRLLVRRRCRAATAHRRASRLELAAGGAIGACVRSGCERVLCPARPEARGWRGAARA